MTCVLLWLSMFVSAMQVTWCLENRVSPNLDVSQAAGNANAVNCSFSRPNPNFTDALYEMLNFL